MNLTISDDARDPNSKKAVSFHMKLSNSFLHKSMLGCLLPVLGFTRANLKKTTDVDLFQTLENYNSCR